MNFTQSYVDNSSILISFWTRIFFYWKNIYIVHVHKIIEKLERTKWYGDLQVDSDRDGQAWWWLAVLKTCQLQAIPSIQKVHQTTDGLHHNEEQTQG